MRQLLRASRGRPGKLTDGARLELEPDAPPDCASCKSFFFDGKNNPIRARLVGEEVSEAMCKSCPFVLHEKGAFEWRPAMRELFQRWRSHRLYGNVAPTTIQEAQGYRELDQIQAAVARGAQE